ncbi:MAG TPA: methyltransferase domain-containing protein [Acidimicrobiia bacterium]|jgi:SAM-dependent methyltransferase|nr:methyltransferase domain-containing protein [Acidimicrobiia bacterium]
MSDTYSAVDRSSDARGAADWQDRIDGWPAIAAYKRRTYELLGPHQPRLDVGCGTGHDLRALGAGAVGVDLSVVMCERARARNMSICVGDALQLPFASRSCAAVRADRVLQHVADSQGSLAELVRVTKPGGRVVLSDPDQGSLLIELPGVSAALVQRVTQLRREIGYRNGVNARRLPNACAELGLVDITIDAFPLVLTDPDDAFGLAGWVEYWRAEGPFDDRAQAEWAAAVQRARTRTGFVFAVLYLVVSGQKPSD